MIPSTKSTWMEKTWRPAMGWVYMATCITDFILFPVLWSILHAYLGHQIPAWEPLTLMGGGLYHVAMGAVLGVTAWSRGKEKIAGVTDNSQLYQSQLYQEQVQNSPNESSRPVRKPYKPVENDEEI